ncbi:hypothetical protein Tcan_14461 [Toxocara canis]|uniref:Uncharacterized protein n=1 Tax=Toxocara canis TaxID=6265 RepID=A0A0B2VDE8_TOXCA|nr:hypothetical protein Tcan_14461 [Toxocara canis]
MVVKYSQGLLVLIIAQQLASTTSALDFLSPVVYLRRAPQYQAYAAYDEPAISDLSNLIKPRGLKRSGSCILNAGLSQGCDLSDMICIYIHIYTYIYTYKPRHLTFFALLFSMHHHLSENS